MPIFYGKSEDGSDAKEFKGFPVSDCGEYWGDSPQSANEAKKIGKKVEWKMRIKNLQNKI